MHLFIHISNNRKKNVMKNLFNIFFLNYRRNNEVLINFLKKFF